MPKCLITEGKFWFLVGFISVTWLYLKSVNSQVSVAIIIVIIF